MNKTTIVLILFSSLVQAEQWGSGEATGEEATAWGHDTQAIGDFSTAWGFGSSADSFTATAWGLGTLSSGENSTSWGYSTIAKGVDSTAWGDSTHAIGNYSTAIGYKTTAHASGSLSIGSYNIEYPDIDPEAPASQDPIFAIGNGVSAAERNNAFTIFRNGLTTIDGDLLVNGLIATTSDARLKTNIHPFDSGEDIVMALEPVTYTLINDVEQRPQIGLIAQEVELLLPQLISESRDGFKAIDYAKLSVVLIDTMKKLKEENRLIKKQHQQLRKLVCELRHTDAICE